MGVSTEFVVIYVRLVGGYICEIGCMHICVDYIYIYIQKINYIYILQGYIYIYIFAYYMCKHHCTDWDGSMEWWPMASIA